MPLTKVKGSVINEPMVSLEDFGDITTELGFNMALIAARAALVNTGRTLYIPAGDYVFNKTTYGGTFTATGFRIRGDGIKNTVIDCPVDEIDQWSLNGDGAGFFDFSLTGHAAVLIGSGNHMTMENVEIDGSSIADSDDRENAIRVNIGAVADHFLLQGCYLHHCYIGLFTPPNFTGSFKHARVMGNTFEATAKGAITLNCDPAAGGVAYAVQNGRISDNTFIDFAGADDGDLRPYAIAFDVCKDFVVANNLIDGYGRTGTEGADTDIDGAIHIENMCYNISVTGNTIVNADIGIEVYKDAENITIDGNTLEGREGHVYDFRPNGWITSTSYSVGDYVKSASKIYQATTAGTSGATAPTHLSGTVSDGGVDWQFISLTYSIFDDPTGGFYSSVGIRVFNPDHGMPGKNVVITDNSVSNFETGIRVGLQYGDVHVSGNNIGLCSAAIGLESFSSTSTIENNTARECKYLIGGYWTVTSSRPHNALLGKNAVVNCYRVRHNPATAGEGVEGAITMTGLKWSERTVANILDASTTAEDLFEMPARMDCKVASMLSYPEVENDNFGASWCSLQSTDGATLSVNTRDISHESTIRVVLAGTNPFAVSGGLLQARITSNWGATTTPMVTLDFDGWLAW